MIRFDTFIPDYDTKNVIVFSFKVVLLGVRDAFLTNGFVLAEGGELHKD